jgi:hypothetical protein
MPNVALVPRGFDSPVLQQRMSMHCVPTSAYYYEFGLEKIDSWPEFSQRQTYTAVCSNIPVTWRANKVITNIGEDETDGLYALDWLPLRQQCRYHQCWGPLTHLYDLWIVLWPFHCLTVNTVDSMMTEKLGNDSEGRDHSLIRYYPGMWLEGLRKSMENFSLYNRYPATDSNRADPQYKSRTLLPGHCGQCVWLEDSVVSILG